MHDSEIEIKGGLNMVSLWKLLEAKPSGLWEIHHVTEVISI